MNAEHVQPSKRCIRCGGSTKIFRTSVREDGVIVRWRFCADCGAEFPTVEVATGYVRTRKSHSARKK